MLYRNYVYTVHFSTILYAQYIYTPYNHIVYTAHCTIMDVHCAYTIFLQFRLTIHILDITLFYNAHLTYSTHTMNTLYTPVVYTAHPIFVHTPATFLS